MRRAAIVVDLGFGDAGKGLVTDALVRALDARVVVRFHGGAQAGHNVVADDGRHHTFSQFAAATFAHDGVRTVLGRRVVLHPTALVVEARALEGKGVRDPLGRVVVSASALVTTPFHQAACRLRELARGAARHGSVGVGVGETMWDAERGDLIRAGELSDGAALARRIAAHRRRKRDELDAEIRALAGDPAAAAEIALLESEPAEAAWRDALGPLVARSAIVPDSVIAREIRSADAVVFEGAQGVLLDEWAGFHPHTTWSTCTFDRALELLDEAGFDGRVDRVGVLRTHAVRHGAGPLPTEDPGLERELGSAGAHNVDGPWQGRVRSGHADLVLARYAARACGGVDALAVTHLDTLARLAQPRVCLSYDGDDGFEGWTRGDDGALVSPPPPRDHDLARQEATGRDLGRVVPRLTSLGHGDDAVETFLDHVRRELGAPVALGSRGPRPPDVTLLAERFRA